MSCSINNFASSSPDGETGAKLDSSAVRAAILRLLPEPSLRLGIPVSFLPGAAVGMTEKFGERLRRIRIERGITVVDLAAAVGAAEGTIRQIETGSVKMPNFVLGVRLANYLNVDPQYLALGEGFSTSERFEAVERRLTKIEKRLAALPATRR
jgi:transcriptional regulator with XRE-family HTH domain